MTTTRNRTVRRVLNGALPDNAFDALRKIKIGNMLSNVKVVAAALVAGTVFDITTLAFKAKSTITGIELDSNEALPPISELISLRVVTATGNIGTYGVTDAGGVALAPGTANGVSGVALLSDDGKTITFPSNVTAFTLIYKPGPAISLDSIFEPTV